MPRNPPVIPIETQLKIIEYWRLNKDNRTAIIAAHFNCALHHVDAIINKHLKTKIRS